MIIGYLVTSVIWAVISALSVGLLLGGSIWMIGLAYVLGGLAGFVSYLLLVLVSIQRSENRL